MTSLCFVANPEQALAEMWCVSRKAVVLGLLNRHSLLYYIKRNSKGYQTARWGELKTVRKWSNHLIHTKNLSFSYATWLHGSEKYSRQIEHIEPKQYPSAGFLALALTKE